MSNLKSKLLAEFRILYGAWRSPVAHCNGVAGVASSNLAAPTKNIPQDRGMFYYIPYQKLSNYNKNECIFK